MAARKKLEYYAGRLSPKEGRKLALMVFGLREQLGISYNQMGEESGLGRFSLVGLKSAWGSKRTDGKFMDDRSANGLVKFWNMHLRNNTNKAIGQKEKVSEMPLNPYDIISVLIRKAGLAKAQELLEAQGKSYKLKAFLRKLTPEQLADLA